MQEYDFDYYKGLDLKYPNKPMKPKLDAKHTAFQALVYSQALEEYEREYNAYEEDLSLYRAQLSDRQVKLIEELKYDYDLSDAQVYVLWGFAYERSHSGGLEEVVSAFNSLHEIVSKYETASKKKD